MSRSSMVEHSTDNRKMIVQFYPGQPIKRKKIMVDLGDDDFEPARDIYVQNIVYVFKDGESIRDTNKAYWPRYTFDLKRKIEKSISEGFSIKGKRYTKNDIESITIVYPE